jgi:hypothetical protein
MAAKLGYGVAVIISDRCFGDYSLGAEASSRIKVQV